MPSPLEPTADESAAAQSLWDRIAAAPSGGTAPVAPTPEAPEPVAQAEPQTAQAVEPEAETAEAQTPEYADFDDYLTKSNLDRDSFLSLPVKLKVDGKEERGTLKELIDGAQLERHVRTRSQQLADQQKQWDAERAQTQQTVSQQYQQATQLAQLAQQELLREYQGVTPADPARFLEAQQRLGAINQYLAQVQQAQAQQLQQQLASEQSKLLAAVPEWRDSAAFQAAQTEISKTAASLGFTQAELSGVFDHRQILGLQRLGKAEAQARDLQAQVDTLKTQLAGKTDAAVKKVRAAPQMPVAGTRVVRDPKVVAISGARERFERNPGNDDAAAAYAQTLLNAGLGA